MRILFILFILLLICTKLFGQFGEGEKEKKQRDQLLEAESYFYYEEFSEALPLYLKLKKQYPDNYNLLYKIGVCYLNIPYEKDNAISYLEKAIQNTTVSYKTDNINETRAPLEAWFYLGNAYRINNRFDDASKMYNKFKELVSSKVYNTELVDQQLDAVEAYFSLSKRPVYFDTENLGDRLNSKFSDFNAVVTPNEDIIVYNQKQQFYDALLFSVKMNGKWLPPINIIPELGVDGDVFATSISSDGTELYLYRSDEFDGNIYVSKFRRGKWTPIKKLNEFINTKYWESHASISYDGKTLYFTSNRKGGVGNLDIYKATRINGDNWLKPENLGSEINTKYNEETPFIAEDSKTLYFSSYGHYNMGGYDVFYSSLLDDKTWSTPLNIGYPLNSPDDDLFFQPIKNGQFAYLSKYYPGNEGRNDIYRYEIYSGQHPRKFKLKLFAGFKDLRQIPSNIKVTILKNDSRDTIASFNIDPLKAKAEHKVYAGNYQIVFEGTDFIKTTENISIADKQSNSEIQITAHLKPNIIEKNPTEEPNLENKTPIVNPIQFEKSFFKLNGIGNVAIPLDIAPGTILAVTILKNGVQYASEEFVVDKENFIYNVNIGSEGTYTVKFNATLPDKSMQTGEVTIIAIAESIVADATFTPEQEILLQEYIDNLTLFGQGNLLKVLQNLDLKKEGIRSIDDLIAYLKDKGQYSGYSPADVDKLINACSIQLALSAQHMFNALNEAGDNNVKLLLKNSVNLTSPTALINSLLIASATNAALQSSLLIALAQLADPGSLFYATKSLSAIGNADLKEFLSSFDPSQYNIKNASDLYSYILNPENNLNIPVIDVVNSLGLLFAATTPSLALFVESLSTNSNNSNLTNLLNTIDLSTLNINDANQLQQYLLENSEKLNIGLSQLAIAIIHARTNESFKNVSNSFNLLSSEPLSNFLLKSDLSENNVFDIENYARFLDNHTKSGNYNQSELIRLMAISANAQLSNFNNQLQKLSDQNPVFAWGNRLIYSGALVLTVILLLIIVLIRRKKKKKKEI